MSIWSYFIVPFAWLMQQCMNLLNNYALALVAYALITKIITFPFSLKQQKNSLNMVRMKPYQDALQKKYGNNREKYSMELQKLYQREGYNPMSSCLPMLIQLPLIFLIYSIVRHPLTYVYYGEYFTANAAQRVYEIAMKIQNLPESIQKVVDKITAGESAVTSISNYELQIYNLSGTTLPGDDLFGIINLSRTPNEQFFSWMLLIPIIACVTSFLVSWVSQKLSPMQQSADPSTQSSNKMMLYMMPLMSLFFTYTLNCALGLYWIIGNVFSIAQTFLLNKIYDPKKVLAEVEEQIEKEKTVRKEKRSAAAQKKAAALAASKKKK